MLFSIFDAESPRRAEPPPRNLRLALAVLSASGVLAGWLTWRALALLARIAF